MTTFMRRLSVIALVIMAFATLSCPAATHYVVPPGEESGTPADPYTSWETAGTNIIEVAFAAQTNDAPRTIWVTNGTYYPTNFIGVTNEMKIKSVNGYTNTILNGALAGTNRCIYLNLSSGDSLFRGFTVTNYHMTTYQNAAILANYASIFDCLIAGNATSYGYGAGLYVFNSTISNCIVRGNSSGRFGGGLSLGNNCIMLDSVIEENTCGGFGGGAIHSNGDGVLVSNCAIINNRHAGNATSMGGGGIICYNVAGTRTFVDCVITGNTSTVSGGGVFGYTVGGYGTFINCKIVGNSASNSGGGIGSTLGTKNLNLRNCLIAENYASTNGGGILFVTATNIVENCTIVSNYAGKVGGGMYLEASGSFTNNIIYHNTAGVSAANFYNAAGNLGLDYSCVSPAVDGTANITEDPRLDPAGADYRLRHGSPCINKGATWTG